MNVILLKSYILNTGKKLPIGRVVNRMRKEAETMIKDGIAEEYSGQLPPKKKKSDLFKPKNIK